MLVDFREGILDFISFEKFIWQTTVDYMYVLYELCFSQLFIPRKNNKEIAIVDLTLLFYVRHV